jgi:murein DD-endopeptidase MepM/ murein hydrolase activator NlpD
MNIKLIRNPPDLHENPRNPVILNVRHSRHLNRSQMKPRRIKIALSILLLLALSNVAYSEQKRVGADYPPPAPTLGSGQRAGCSCGTLQFHSGADWNAKEGTAIPVADDGVVVKVEENEKAIVYSSTGGFCGRYVVVKHSYPNGRTVYSRYAQLGRLVGNDGKAVRVGARLKSRDKIGEVGNWGLFHFEVRPVESKTMDSGAWSNLDTGDPSLEWAKYHPADPGKFDFDEFAGRVSPKK